MSGHPNLVLMMYLLFAAHFSHCTVKNFLSFQNFLIYCNFQSSNPPFTSIELDHSDSGREGCTVTTLTVTAEPKNWQSAIKVAVQEVCISYFTHVRVIIISTSVII